MLYANLNERRVRARPGLKATCADCGDEMISKCGSIIIWHWALRAR